LASEDISDALERVCELNRIVKPADAAETMRGVLLNSRIEDVLEMEQRIRQSIESFLPKRRTSLKKLLAQQLANSKVPESMDIIRFHEETRSALKTLSEEHIFQWPTFYRQVVSRTYLDALNLGRRGASEKDICRYLRDAFDDHSLEIFQKGYQHVLRKSMPFGVVLVKSISGLRRFTDLCLEYYVMRATHLDDVGEVRRHRLFVSSILAGILSGFGKCVFGDETGYSLMIQDSPSWMHLAPFLAVRDLRQLVMALGPSTPASQLEDCVIPLSTALDNMIERTEPDSLAVPRLSQAHQTAEGDTSALDVTLAAAGNMQPLEIRCLMDESALSKEALLDAAVMGTALVLASLPDDLQAWVDSEDSVRSIVINPRLQASPTATNEKAEALLLRAVSRARIGDDSSIALAYNYARHFPLKNPSLAHYFFVERPSVVSLLQGFERGYGIHLWTSVRRSGKTTAAFNLGSNTGLTRVVPQACQGGNQFSQSDTFIAAVDDALATREILPRDFFQSQVRLLLNEDVSRDTKLVFVLDEYESLFEKLEDWSLDDRKILQGVALPLLNQMVEFSRDNLLVFLGQRPDAHFILMDQNPLSPYVQHDSFPLFSFAPGIASSEFRLLSERIMSDCHLEDSFCQAVYSETAGHPFLTVNVLVDFVDWLIQRKWRASARRFDGDLFRSFAGERLSLEALARSPEYDMMSQVAASALAINTGKTQTPWLHVIYQFLRFLGSECGDDMTITVKEATELFERSSATLRSIHVRSEQVMRQAARSNFIEIIGSKVQPKIRMLARIAATAAPEVH